MNKGERGKRAGSAWSGTAADSYAGLAGEAVADACGVFVSSSLGADDTDPKRGTKEKPFKSLTAALAAASDRPVYACGEAFREVVTVSAAVTLFGALECANGWAYDASTKTQLTADPDAI